MKLTTCLMLFAFLQVGATGVAQKVSLNENKTNLEKVLKKIGHQTGYTFLYENKVLRKASPVTLKVNDAPLDRVLQLCFQGQPLMYKVFDQTVVIKEKLTQYTIKIEEEPELLPLANIVTGKVTNSKGDAMVGVSVTVKGTKTGTLTDENGNYSIDVPVEGALVFSYVGYVTKEMPVNGRSSINMTLEVSDSGLDEIVVVGYGTQRREEITSAISTVKSEDFVKGFAADAGQLIKGKVSGLTINTPDGNPTSSSQLNLRGITTLSGSTQPLILVDGIPGDLNTVSPDDIASIDVLKDGSAAAIYGTRGTNGVILITTKSGKNNLEPSIDLRTDFTTQRIKKKLNFMNPDEYRELVGENKPGARDFGSNTDWLSLVTQKPLTQNYDLSLKGGGKETNYIVGLNYKDMNGIIKRSNNVVIRPNIKVIHSMFDGKLKITGDLNGYQQHYFSGVDGGSYNNNVYKNGLTYNPTDSVKDADGNWTEHTDITDYMNPVSLLEETKGKNQNSHFRSSGNILFNPIKDLKFNLLFSRDLYESIRGYYETKKNYSNVRTTLNGFASRGTTRSLDNLTELTGTYDRNFGAHHVTGLLGYSRIKNNYQDYWMQNWDFPTDAFTYNNISSGLALTRGEARENSIQTENTLISYFGRINYSFQERFLITLSLRREASSKFGQDNKWGNFPAISAGWNLKREEFIKNSEFISDLKIRGGFGITGTEPNDPYKSLSILNFNSFVFLNGQWIQTPSSSQNPNPDLRWEKKRETNIGVDFGLLNNKITGSLDFYKRTTKDLLFNYPVATPPFLLSTIFANAATMENKGVELSLNYTTLNAHSSLGWRSEFNFSNNHNKLVSLSDRAFQLASGYFDAGSTGEPIQQPTHRVQIGQPIGNFWGFKSVDIDDAGHWIIEGQDGKSKPISQQTADDKQILGNGIPKTNLNWVNTITYKDFDLTVNMHGAFGFQILNMSRLFYSAPIMLTRGNLLENAYDNIYGKVPLADNQELQYVSYYIEDGAYWKIDNITLGYNLNVKSRIIKNLRLYFTAENIATITGYGGVDPEVNILGMNPGVDDKYRYPSIISYTMGLYLHF